MSTIVTIHSFRRGVGKSSLAASLAVLLAQQGRRVALVDADFRSPALHLFFGLPEGEISHALNDYLRGACSILAAAVDVTSIAAPDSGGALFLVPSSCKPADVMQFIRAPMSLDRYMDGLETLGRELNLDMILADTSAGLNEDTLQAIVVSNAVVLVLHPDKRDFQGTAVTVDMIRRLQIPAVHLVLNDAPEALDVENARRELEEAYHCGGGMALKHSAELMALSSGKPFALAYPNHPLTDQLRELARLLPL